MQRDPLGYVDGMNLMEYVGSNPVNWSDPTGAQASKEDKSYMATGIVENKTSLSFVVLINGEYSLLPPNTKTDCKNDKNGVHDVDGIWFSTVFYRIRADKVTITEEEDGSITMTYTGNGDRRWSTFISTPRNAGFKGGHDDIPKPNEITSLYSIPIPIIAEKIDEDVKLEIPHIVPQRSMTNKIPPKFNPNICICPDSSNPTPKISFPDIPVNLPMQGVDVTDIFDFVEGEGYYEPHNKESKYTKLRGFVGKNDIIRITK